MADTDTPPADEQQQRSVDVNRVIAKLSGRIADQARQLAVAEAMLDQAEEDNAALRAELVAVTAGAPVTKAA